MSPSDTHPDNSPVAIIAADDAELRSFLTETLRQSGYEVTEIGDSRALAAFLSQTARTAKGAAGVRADLIVSDISVPGRTALEILAELKKAVRGIPVVLMTAFDDPQTRKAAMDIGATAVFDKPFNIEEFKAFLTRSVSLAQGVPEPGLEIA